MTMKGLAADPRVKEFFSRLARARARLLLLDYDGTLAPFRTNRERAEPYPGVRERLAAIQERGATRLVILSGRIAQEVPPLLGLHPPPEVWGGHGSERLRLDGVLELLPLAPAAAAELAAAESWLGKRGWGAFAERKHASVALHWRALPAALAGEMGIDFAEAWKQRAATAGLELRPFDGGLEMRLVGVGKGAAVRALLAEMPAGTVAAFLGDDGTDEDAFAALPATGLSVLLGERPRPTLARLWLQPPDELLDFLDRWRAACGAD